VLQHGLFPVQRWLFALFDRMFSVRLRLFALRAVGVPGRGLRREQLPRDAGRGMLPAVVDQRSNF
jgi:hypothetical protein